MNQYDKNGLIIKDGKIIDISLRVIESGGIVIPSTVKYIPTGLSSAVNVIKRAKIQYENVDNLISVIKSPGFKWLMGYGTLTLEGPLLTHSEKEIINYILEKISVDYYRVSYNVTYDNDLLTQNIENEYRIEDGILLYFNPYKSKFIIPNGVTKIDTRDLIFSDDVEEMYYYKIEEIIMPDTVTHISMESFRNLSSLETIKMSKNIAYIGNGAFKGCSKLKKIKLPVGLKTIGILAFDSCSSLEEIVFPTTLKSIGKDSIRGCRNLKNIVFKYESFEKLLSLINNSSFFNSSSSYFYILMFEGPELSIIEKLKIKRAISCKNIKVSYKVNNNVLEEEKEEPLVSNEDDIQTILNRITNLCKHLPDTTKESINMRIRELLETYDKDLEQLKPKYGKSDSDMFELKTVKSLKTLKPTLIADLERIITSITTINGLIKFLEDLQAYQELLSMDISELSDDTSIYGYINNILYMINSFSNSDEEKYKELLQTYINEAIEKANNEVTRYLSNNPKLLIVEDYKLQFDVKVSSLYDEISSKYEKIKPYRELYDSLNILRIEPVIGDINTISGFINTIYYAINNLSDGNYKTELFEEFKKLLNKHSATVFQIIYYDEVREKAIYDDIELDLRSDLQPLIEKIDKYAYLDRYVKHEANKTNIMNQLLMSIEIINNGELVEQNEELPIVNFVTEINNKILTNKLIDKDTRKEITDDLLNKLNDCIASIEERKVDTVEEYNQVLLEIMKLLAGVNIDVSVYIQNVIEYNNSMKAL